MDKTERQILIKSRDAITNLSEECFARAATDRTGCVVAARQVRLRFSKVIDRMLENDMAGAMVEAVELERYVKKTNQEIKERMSQL